jgi:hypothetical protein
VQLPTTPTTHYAGDWLGLAGKQVERMMVAGDLLLVVEVSTAGVGHEIWKVDIMGATAVKTVLATSATTGDEPTLGSSRAAGN